MGDSQNSHLLPHILLILSPDVFFHPLWIYYFPKLAALSSEIIDQLQIPIQRLLGDGDFRNAAQLMLVCAALQMRYGDPHYAIDTIQKVWEIGLSRDMSEIAGWAAWGGCAICAEQGEYFQAAEYLESLQGQLEGGEEWLLVSTLDVLKHTLQEVKSDQGSVQEVLNWTRRWGEPSYEISLQTGSNGYPRPVTHHQFQSRQLPRFSLAWWRALIKIFFHYITGELILWGEPEDQDLLQDVPVIHPVTSLSLKKESQQLYDPFLPIANDKEAGQEGEAPEKKNQTLQNAMKRNRLSLQIYCLGSFRLYQDDQWVYRWVSRKALSVLKYLVLYHPDPVSKDVLMDTLWPDADPESARRNLHQAIYTLRNTLKEVAPEFQHILFEKEHYSLNPQMEIWLDFVEFERQYHKGQNRERLKQYYEAIRSYEAAELLYKGDFLGGDLYEDLPVARRQYFWEMYLSTAYRLTRCYLELGQVRAAIAANQRVLERDKTQEPAHQNLMTCYIRQGQRNLAIHQYHKCVQILKEELDVPPSAETRAIYQKVIQM
jgi:DNA-binding SARP family transcriptional activator